MASTELAKREENPPETFASDVREEDEPSARWGWHGTLPKGALLGGIFVVIILITMVRMTDHMATHAEMGFTVGIGALVLFLIIRKQVTRRRSAWRR
jgi:uncharacterized membrane protein